MKNLAKTPRVANDRCSYGRALCGAVVHAHMGPKLDVRSRAWGDDRGLTRATNESRIQAR